MENLKKNKTVPVILITLYAILFATLSIKPYSREVWFAENLPVVLIVLLLVLTYKKYQFTAGSYIFMSVFIFMHTIGGHFTFELVPFDFINNLFGFERNNYDRFAHFSVGFYAYALFELLHYKAKVKSFLVKTTYPVLFIFTVAAVYEIIEWWYAAAADPKAGLAFLGSQGDIWDAQKDMLCDGSGAVLAVIIFIIIHRKSLKKD